MKKERFRFRYVILMVFFGFSGVTSQAQMPAKEKIVSILNNFNEHYPQEKVYVQSDRSLYAAGENIWFSAYVEYQQKSTTLSGILHVWLTDSDGKGIIQKTLPVIGGKANGNIELPDTLHSGSYQLVAFTSWMLNFDPSYIFHKNIVVLNSGRIPEKSAAVLKDNYSFDVFPEGGNLITGLQSTIAFKAANRNGYPLDISGQVVDDAGHVITSFQSVHDGMGTFVLTPAPDKKYIARINLPGNKTADYPLPPAQSSGIVLHVSNRQLTEQKIYVLLQRDTTSGENKQVIIALQSGEKLLTPEISFVDDKAAIAIPGELFSSGILHITVFDDKGLPLAERITFNRNEKDILPLQLQKVHISGKARVKNTFTIRGFDTTRANVSIAVTDAELVPDDQNDDNILSNLLMTSDIKGYVHNPGWYFTEPDTTRLRALDLVMMTNGWSRYTWKKLLANDFPSITYPIEQRLMLRGQILTEKRSEPIKNGKVVMDFVAANDGLYKTFTFNTDDSGNFALNLLGYHDKGQFYFDKVNTADGKHPSFKVRIKNPLDTLSFLRQQDYFAPPTGVKDFMTIAGEQNDVMKKMIDKSILLPTVTVEARKKTHLDSINLRYASPLFNSAGERSFDIQKDWSDRKYLSVLDVIQNMVPGIVVENKTMYWRLTTGMAAGNLDAAKKLSMPAVFINEVPVYTGGGGDLATQTVDELEKMKLNNVALIKIFRPGFVGSPGGSPHGAIAIYLASGGDEPPISHSEGAVAITKNGYALVKEFYSPDYSQPADNKFPDKRITLYWNPELTTDSSGTATFSFYNNDITRKYHITIEGIDNTGKIGRIEKIIDLDSNKQ